MSELSDEEARREHRRYRAVSPSGVLPEGHRDWPTWDESRMTLAAILEAREKWFPDYRLEVEVTTVSPWTPYRRPSCGYCADSSAPDCCRNQSRFRPDKADS